MANPSNDGWVDEAGWQDEKPASSGHYANPDAHNNPVSPSTPERTLLDRFLNPPGHGKAGGIVGGIAGSIVGGLPGMVLGGAAGNYIGQHVTIGDDEVRAGPPKYDAGAAVADGVTQGLIGGALKIAGAGAARLGFPRVAAVLGSKAPQQAMIDAAPAAARAIGTPALEAVDAAGTLGAGAAKEKAAILAEQARRSAVQAVERQLSEKAMPPIQQRMAGRVPGLAQKTGEFVDELETAVKPDRLDSAFTDTPSVPEAARNPAVMGKRSEMIQAAVPQTADNQALKLARRPIAAANARGVSAAGDQEAADAAGLRALGGAQNGGDAMASRILNRVPGVGTAAQMLGVGGLPERNVPLTVAALLQGRGLQPMSSQLSNNPLYRAAPTTQATTEMLRQLLDRMH